MCVCTLLCIWMCKVRTCNPKNGPNPLFGGFLAIGTNAAGADL